MYFDKCLKYIIIEPFLPREYNLFSQNTESYLER